MSVALSRRRLVVIGSLAGIALFGLTVRAVDPAAILAGARRVGEGFWLICLLAGVRLAARAAAWTICAGGRSRLPFGSALAACVVGEAAGNMTPFGPAASEPSKVLWVRPRLVAVEAGASLAVETLVYSLAVTGMLIAGSMAWIATFAPADAVYAVIAILLGIALVVAIVWTARDRLLLWSPPFLKRLDATGAGRPRVGAIADGIRRSLEILRHLVSDRPHTLVAVAFMEAVFQAAAVAEVWLMLVLLGVPEPTLLHAFLLEYANRVVTVVFKIVPMRLGVDELASGAMASLLGSGGTVGVTLAVVRKARVLCWSLAGLGLVGARAIASRGRREPARVVAERS